jgi:hypothetical protein
VRDERLSVLSVSVSSTIFSILLHIAPNSTPASLIQEAVRGKVSRAAKKPFILRKETIITA